MIQQKNDAIKYIKSILGHYGFKHNGTSFILEKDKLTCVIHVQRSTITGDKGELQKVFTLNWGIYLSIADQFYQNTIHKRVSFNDCIICGRVFPLTDSKTDRWLDIACKAKTAEEIKKILMHCAIPFFDKINTIEDLIDLLEAAKKENKFYNFSIEHPNPEPFQAILYSFIGEKDKSYEILDSIINTSKSKLYIDNIILLKEKINNFNMVYNV